jgi:hypothetical protein
LWTSVWCVGRQFQNRILILFWNLLITF